MPFSHGGPRVLLRRLREIMAEPVSAQERLDRIVVLIAGNMVAEVCSVYVMRSDGALELYATEGLKREAVHLTLPATSGSLGEEGAALLVWTTQPWTLVPNVSVVVGPEIDYVLVEATGEDGRPRRTDSGPRRRPRPRRRCSHRGRPARGRGRHRRRSPELQGSALPQPVHRRLPVPWDL